MIRSIKNFFGSILSFIGGLFTFGKKKTDEITLSIKESQLTSSIAESPGQTLEKAKQLAAPITENSGQALEKTKQLASAAIGSSGQVLEQALGSGDKTKSAQPATQASQSNGKVTEVRKSKQIETKQPAKVKAAKSNGSQVKASGSQTKSDQSQAKAGKAQTKSPEAQATPSNEALNLPKPKVTTSSNDNYSSFGDRRYPGSNMSSFLKMARQMKPAK